MEPLSQVNLLTAFLGGLATSFTPCVYPLIPITLAIFGAGPEVPRLRACALSCTYVAGIAVTYTVLGMLSAWSGTLFGQSLGNPWVVATVCFFLLLLSLYTLDIIKLETISQIQNKASVIGGRGFGGAFLMGTVSGLVAAPCAAPILIPILGLAAATKSAFWGGALLFSYALGFGVLFLVLGTFAGLIRKLPKSGDWLHLIKFVVASLLLLLALFILNPFLGDTSFELPLFENIGLLVVFTVLAFYIATIGYRHEKGMYKIVAAGMLALCGSSLLFSPHTTTTSILNTSQPNTSLDWHSSLEEGLKIAKKEDKLIMVDFFAEWCAACKELDLLTFPDPQVMLELKNFVTVRLDLTLPSDGSQELQNHYGILGLPAILFLSSDGIEVTGTRVEGFLGAKEFREHLRKITPPTIPLKAHL